MFYRANFIEENGSWLVDFPDCPGCQTYGETKEEAVEMAVDALEGWLEACLITGKVPPRPDAYRGTKVKINQSLSMILRLRWAARV